MLRKVYLTKSLPQETLISHSLPDVKQMMDNYKQNKRDFMNEAPEIHPQPLEKYEGRKTKIEIQDKERADEIQGIDEVEDEDDGKNYEDMFLTLPQASRKRAKRLLPYVLKVNYGNLKLRDLLYDLCVPRVKTIKSNNREVLESVYRQLESNSNLPRSYYVHKLSSKTPKNTPRTPKVLTHPTKSNKKMFSTPRKQYSTSTLQWR